MHVIHFIRDNLKVISWILTAALLVFIVVLGVGRWQSYRVKKADDRLFEAQKFALATPEQQKILEEVADDYTSTPAGREAMMALGDQFFARGDFQAALEKYEELQEHSAVPLMKVAALHKVAAAQRALGKLDDAAKTYLTAAAYPKNLNKADSFYQAAGCYEELKQYDEAAKLYKKVMEISEEGGAKLKSEERLLWLVANGSISG